MLRRYFLSRLGLTSAAIGFQNPQAAALAPAPGSGTWQPARHEKDDWLETLPGKHRVIFDTFTASKFDDAMLFAGNLFRAGREYDLTDGDLALVICVRHQTAPFAFNDAMWAKYSAAFSKRMEWVDPKSGEAPKVNVYTRQLSGFIKQGVHLAVCNLSTRAYTSIIARESGRPSDEVYKELTGNTFGNAHFVPAGVLTSTHAQERGYAIISTG